MAKNKWHLLGFFMGMAVAATAGSIYDLKAKNIDGAEVAFSDYKGKVLLIVNVASECRYTRQYAALERLHQKYKDAGLVVMGFPCNQFGGQEPGTNEEIKNFCSTKFHLSFPLFSKIEANGANRHPLYATLAGKESPFPGDIRWNFTKFLVGRDGRILQRFESKVAPENKKLTMAIEAALAAK